jgi:GMP synthase-like glutamine amidotransferase
VYASAAMAIRSTNTGQLKPLRIFRHRVCEGPGYLGTYLEAQGIPIELVCIDQGVQVPMDLDGVSGLIFMGAAGSVNDPLDWIARELELIRWAVQRDVPVMGICFGGQLMAKALGGSVSRGRSGMEIGWHPVERVDSEADLEWLDSLPRQISTFQWHADAFTPPPQALPLLRSRCFGNQAFVLGPHLAMQFHLEMTEKMIQGWIRLYGSDIQANPTCIQEVKELTRGLDERLARLHRVADVIYGAWLRRAGLHGNRSG